MEIMTREMAIALLIEKDVARLGEEARAAAEYLRGRLSHGRALNALAYYNITAVDMELSAQADSALTEEDWIAIRHGGG